MENIDTIKTIEKKYLVLSKLFNEKNRRIWAATEATAIGYGGPTIVAKATKISRTTIYTANKEIKKGFPDDSLQRIRSKGGGRKRITEIDSTILKDLEQLVDPVTRGDPESPLRWTCKSVRQLSEALKNKDHKIGRQKIADLLKKLGYSLQSNRKIKEGSSHPDRDAQFNFINNLVKKFQKQNQPVISVDTKKKELIGNFKNDGKEWQPKGKPEEVDVYDFIGEGGKVSPYGIYDQTKNVGWVSVGIDHDTSEFAVESIKRWWNKMGHKFYPDAKELLITADGGGSNGYRVRLWKYCLQDLANELNLKISVCHFPPGTSKWNKIEHRMFSFISQNWRGKPLTSHEVVVNLIANTTNKKGLQIKAEIDTNTYETGKKVSDKEIRNINLVKNKFHGEWNYSILTV